MGGDQLRLYHVVSNGWVRLGDPLRSFEIDGQHHETSRAEQVDESLRSCFSAGA